MGTENKQCTSDYWAEDKSAWFDRLLLPASHPVSPSSPLLLHPCLTSFLSPQPSISPSPLLNTHPSQPPPSSRASYRSFSLFVSLLSLSPSFTVLQLRSIGVCRFKTLRKYWSEQKGGRARSPGPNQERSPGSSTSASVPLLLTHHAS